MIHWIQSVITNPFVIIIVSSSSRLGLVLNGKIDLGSNLEHPFFQFHFKLVMLLWCMKPPKHYWVMNPIILLIDVQTVQSLLVSVALVQ